MKQLFNVLAFVCWLPALSAEVPPSFEAHCFKCHDATQTEGDLDLEDFVSRKPGAEHVVTLEDIILRIEEHDMPPKKSRNQPKDAERAEMIAWARGQINVLAEASMDDPGRVEMSRLTRPEYRNVIRDLSGGIVLKAGEYLPNEGGAGEGFSNVGEAQGMGVAQFEKYLEAAKGALKHLRVSPHDGLVWSAVPREPVEDVPSQIKECVDDLIAWHVAQQQKWGAEHREKLAAKFGSAHGFYLELAFRAKTDRQLPDEPFSAVALEKWQRILADEKRDSPFADWAKAWRAIPASISNEKLRAECQAIALGKHGGSTEVENEDYAPPYEISFHEAREEVLEAATKHGHWPFRIDIGDARELFLIVTDAGDGGRGEYAVWQKGRIVFKDGSAKPWQDAVQIVGANSGKPFAWGVDGEGSQKLGPDAIGVRPPGALKFAVPENAIVFEVDLTLDKNRTKLASIQALVLKEKPKSQSYIPGRYVFGGKKREADASQKGNKEREQLLRKRNVSEANLTKVGLNAERNVFTAWKHTTIEAIGGPWTDQGEDKEEPNAPYHYSATQVRRNATPEDLAALEALEGRLAALTRPADEAKAARWLADFARKAWRGHLSDAEKALLAKLYRDAAKPGVSFDSAMKVPLLAVLMSPEFIYRGTSDLASRLSFFLWASIPDDELLAADLSKPDVLKAQTQRMLRDPRARALAEVFAAQVWHFEDFETFTGPDEKRFPEFTAARRREMLDEVHAALNRVFLDDAPLSRLLDEDCLATKPLFLTKTSLPLRSSPVQRGAWVVETLIGRRIPPPPPNVPKLSEDEKSSEGFNIQQQLAKHRADANCAACHAKIDPPGIALENFDPIGRWRDTERDGSRVVNTETLADGSEMKGVEGLKTWLKSREHEFCTNFHRKLLGYALGRAVLPGDKRLLERMARQETFSGMVLEIVTSRQFTQSVSSFSSK
jgi:mono/diheme cytochrome c family protein